MLTQFLTRTSRGWERAWRLIAAKYGDRECHVDGEVWQYMGSDSDDNGATWSHKFRHRALPPSGERVYEKIPAIADDFVQGEAPC